MNSASVENNRTPMLSICIPTFNRSQLLAITLASIVQHILGQDVEVIVCDNASTDGTEAMVNGFIQQCPAIRYFRNSCNIGFDRNLLQVLRHATGEYCWTLGSDDAVTPEAIPRILDAMRSSPDIIMGDAVNCDVHLQPTGVLKFLTCDACDLNFQALEDVQLFLQQATMHASFFGYIGAMVYRRQALLDTPPRASYIGSGYIHVSIALEILFNSKGTLHYVAKPLAFARRDNEDNVDGTAGLLRHYIDYQLFRRCLDDYFTNDLGIHNTYKAFVRKIFGLTRDVVQLSGITFVDQFRRCFATEALELPNLPSPHMPRLVRAKDRLLSIQGLESLFLKDSVLHIGFRDEYDMLAQPIVTQAIGYDRHYIASFDGIHVPFETDSLDVVWASYCFHQFPDLNPAMRDWLNVTKPGGMLVISALLPTNADAAPSTSSETPIQLNRLFDAIAALLQGGRCRILHCAQTAFASGHDRANTFSEIDVVLEKESGFAEIADAVIQAAMQHHQSGNLAEAERAYTRILSMQPNHFIATHMLGVVHFQRGKLVSAEQLVRHAIQINDGIAEAHYNLGCILQAAQQYGEARWQLQRSIALSPTFAPAHARLAELSPAQVPT